jgi:CheY-like chemotaxis protein
MSPRCILVVDDQSAVRRAIARHIRTAFPQYHVVEARDGIEALRAMSPSVALVVTDLDMPRMDGFQLCRSIRSQTGRERDTPVVVVSSHSTDLDRLTAEDAGATLQLAKPLDVAALVAAMRGLLGDFVESP